MAARKGTILSDEHILKECAHYRPIPMKLATKMLDGGALNVQSPFTSKKLKYQRQLSRPEHFDSYAHSIARNLGNDPEFRGRLHTAYTADVAQHSPPVNEAPPGPDAFFMNNVNPILQGLRDGPLNPHYNDNFVPPAPAAPPPPPPNVYDFGANEEPEEDHNDFESAQSASSDDAFEGYIIDSEDEGPPALEEVPELEEENENEPAPEANDPEANEPEPNQDYLHYYLMGVEKFLPPPHGEKPAKKMKERETQFLPKPLPKANVSGMKLRSGTQLQGPSPKLRQGMGPKRASLSSTASAAAARLH